MTWANDLCQLRDNNSNDDHDDDDHDGDDDDNDDCLIMIVAPCGTLLSSMFVFFLWKISKAKEIVNFSKTNRSALALRARALCGLWKIYKCLFIPNCTRKIMWFLINKIHKKKLQFI